MYIGLFFFFHVIFLDKNPQQCKFIHQRTHQFWEILLKITNWASPWASHYSLTPWVNAEPPSKDLTAKPLASFCYFMILFIHSFIRLFNSHWIAAVYLKLQCVWWKQKWIGHTSEGQRTRKLEEKAGNEPAWCVWVEVEPVAMFSCVWYRPESITDLSSPCGDIYDSASARSKFPFPNPSVPGVPPMPLLSPESLSPHFLPNVPWLIILTAENSRSPEANTTSSVSKPYPLCQTDPRVRLSNPCYLLVLLNFFLCILSPSCVCQPQPRYLGRVVAGDRQRCTNASGAFLPSPCHLDSFWERMRTTAL